jgi:hypothetical protein
MRESLGKGITFTVEQADIPIREALGDWTYTKFAKGQRMGYFADHTGTKWSWDTVVAYKSIRDRKSKADIMPELVKELRVLCHQPLQNHPNIVRLLGLTWLREEDMASSLASSEVIGTREWPVILTEKATLGSLSEFLRSGKELRSPISLVAKLNFAGNILLALTVSGVPCFGFVLLMNFCRRYMLVAYYMGISSAKMPWSFSTLKGLRRIGQQKSRTSGTQY